MRRVIRSNHIHEPVSHRGPSGIDVTTVSDRRIDHGVGTQPVIGVGRPLGEVVEQHLHRGDVAIVVQVVQFLRRRDMQNMGGPPGAAGQRHEAAGAEERRLDIAPLGVARIGHALMEEVLAVSQAILVLAVIGDAAAAGPHHAF